MRVVGCLLLLLYVVVVVDVVVANVDVAFGVVDVGGDGGGIVVPVGVAAGGNDCR